MRTFITIWIFSMLALIAAGTAVCLHLSPDWDRRAFVAAAMLPLWLMIVPAVRHVVLFYLQQWRTGRIE